MESFVSATPLTPIESSVPARAVVLSAPREVRVVPTALHDAGPADVVVDVRWSGISSGTERLLWSGEMPPFPGMAYPLVPGYEAVGTIGWAGPESGRAVGQHVFVPGGRCHRDVANLFGASSSRLVVPGERATPVPSGLGRDAVLLALAATAHHALAHPTAEPVELIVGHGVLGRLIARIATGWGEPAPIVWERDPARREGARGYAVRDPERDGGRDYRGIVDASGDATILDRVLPRLARGSEIVLAGFYDRVSFAFPMAFMREARIRVSAEFTPADVEAVLAMIAEGALSLDNLVTHAVPAESAEAAYATAFGDPACLKMVLDWSAR